MSHIHGLVVTSFPWLPSSYQLAWSELTWTELTVSLYILRQVCQLNLSSLVARTSILSPGLLLCLFWWTCIMFAISSLCRWHSSWRKQRGCTSASLRIGSSSSRPHPAPRSPTGKWSMMVPHGPSSALVGGKNDIYVDKMKFYISITMTTITPDKLHLPQLDVPCLSLAPQFPTIMCLNEIPCLYCYGTSQKIRWVVSEVYTRPHKVDFTTDFFYWIERHLQWKILDMWSVEGVWCEICG